MLIRNTKPLFAHLCRRIDTLDSHFPGNYRFGPLSTVAAIMALSARCLVDSYEESLEFVHTRWGNALGWDAVPAKSGLSAARKRLGSEPMRQLWQGELAQAEQQIKRSIGGLPEDRRYVALDGSWIHAPDTHGVRKRWSQAGRSAIEVPQVLMVTAVEIQQRLPVAASVVGLDQGERAAALRLLDDLDQSDVLLMDRGYPGREWLGAVVDRGLDYVVRMVVGAGSFPEVEEFWRSGEDDAVCQVTLGKMGSVPMRLIRRRFPAGRPRDGETREKMVLMTTLLDVATYSHDTILHLYAARWEAETFYRECKADLGIETFHSRDPEGVLQEIYAHLTWMTMYAMVENLADQALEELHGPQKWDDPHRYVINRAQLARAIRRDATSLLSTDPYQRAAATQRLDATLERLVSQAQRKRPGRFYKRERRRPYGRWDPSGKKRKKS